MLKQKNLTIFERFFQSEKASGVSLLCCVFIALFIANIGLGEHFSNFLDLQIGFRYAAVDLEYSIATWINDGLMAVFFLYVGLEIKRELLEGELSNLQKAALPVFAAVGGMLLPAAIFVLFNSGKETISGWGIPMATDIAFALAIVGLLGKSVPKSLKIFLAALAIVDDLGAILVIALFYSSEIHFAYLGMAGGVLLLLVLMNWLGIQRIIFYLIPGLCLWYFIHHSGIHATIAGVLLALMIPTNQTNELSPLQKLEHGLAIPVNFFIMPIFALANTNITFTRQMFEELFSPLTFGISLGLLAGKPLGISLFSWLAVKIRVAKLPNKAQWKDILGVGLLAGIGFTMSIFISLLSFSNKLDVQEAKFAILVTSIIAGVSGFVYLKVVGNKRNA